MWRALWEQLARRYPERNVGAADLLLGAGDALRDGGFALQQRAGDLGEGQADTSRRVSASCEVRSRAG